jgi:hypothetical protein
MPEPKTLDKTAKQLWTEMAIIWGVQYRTIPEDKSEAMEKHILAALQQARDLGRAERDKEWQAKMDTEGRAVVLAKLKEVVAEERKALREIVETRRKEDDKKRPLSVLRTTDQAVCDDILAALDARSAPAEPSSDPVGGVCNRCGAATGSVMPGYRGSCECGGEVVAAPAEPKEEA